MRFGNCPECSEYKYLGDMRVCRSCRETKDWGVFRQICEGDEIQLLFSGLSEEEAKKKAEGHKILFADRVENVSAG